jgi:PPOX class probable F420-dependent enzyme
MIDQKARELAGGANFAVITTLGRDGTPMTQPMWVDTDGEHLLLNTEVHRQKFRNLQNDPRVTVTIIDSQDPYRYAEVRGRVVDTSRGDVARNHIDQLAKKYMGLDEYPGQIQSERVILKIQ